MKRELTHLKIGKKEYPIYCDMSTLEQIQEKMGLYEFEHALVGKEILRDENGDPEYDLDGIKLKYRSVEPKIAVIMYALMLFINEGILVEAEEAGKCPIPANEREIVRNLNIPFAELVSILHNEFNRCFEVKKNLIQETDSEKKHTLNWILRGYTFLVKHVSGLWRRKLKE